MVSQRKGETRGDFVKRANENRKEYYYRSSNEINRRANRKRSRKGGEYYQKGLEYDRTGLRGERNRMRGIHGARWRKYKGNWLMETQIHHEWIPEIADYRGIALVEKDQHLHGFIDVIQILEGEITLFEERKYPF